MDVITLNSLWGLFYTSIHMQAYELLYLRGDTHAARNIHAEHHHSVFHVLVVVIVPRQQVEVIAASARALAGAPSPAAAGGHTLLTTTELACPHLEKGGRSCWVLFKDHQERMGEKNRWENFTTHIYVHGTETRQGGAAFLTNHGPLHVLLACSCW